MSTAEVSKSELRRFQPYPAYKDSGVEWLGEIPTGWDAAKMWRISSATSGGTPAKEERGYWDGEIPWVSPKDMKRRFIDSSEDTITERALAETGIRLIAPPVVLIVVRGMILAHTFPVAITTVPVTINQDMKALHFRQTVEPTFAAWLFEGVGKRILGAVVEEAAHGTKVIRMDRWRAVVAPVPPADEQRAIATFLDRETARIDALVAKKERLIELLQGKRTGLITRAVTKGLDPNVPMKDSGVEWLGEIPAHWEARRLKQIVPQITVGIVVTPSKYYVDEGIPCLRSLNIAQGRVYMKELVFISASANDLHRKSQIFEGDLVVVRTGRAGTAVVVPPDLNGSNCIDLLIIRRSEYIDSRFLYYFINSQIASAQVEAHSVGAIQEHYNTGTLANLCVSMMPLLEQRAIVSFLDRETARLDALIAKVRAAIDRLEELRTALISAAVTGKIDVRNIASTPAWPDLIEHEDGSVTIDAGSDDYVRALYGMPPHDPED